VVENHDTENSKKYKTKKNTQNMKLILQITKMLTNKYHKFQTVSEQIKLAGVSLLI